MISLFNSHDTREFHCLLIQEPHINWASHLPMSDPNWHLMPPLMTNPPSLTGNTRIKSVIYVNNQLPSHSIAPILTNSPLIAGITLALPFPHPSIHLFLAYLPPGKAQEMMPLRDILASLNSEPTLVGMDSNLHHSMWNPSSYNHTHRESEDLITLMNEAGLLLGSEAGTPTFIPHQARSGQTTVDLQWMKASCYNWATVCRTDSNFEKSHFSDHLAIITELDLPTKPLSSIPPRTKTNWAKANWETFRTQLSTHLGPILESLRLQPDALDVDETANNITTALTAAIHASTPNLTLSHHTRRWWCAKTLNPLKVHANNLRRKAQRTNSHADRVAYRAAQHAYQHACKEAKITHWCSFLANLTARDLFTAARYTNGPPGSRTLPPLRKPDGQLTSNPAEQTDLLFQATGGPTIPCDLSDVTLPTPRQPFSTPFTSEDIQVSIKRLKLGKAPGTDGITNQVIREAPGALSTILASLLNACVKTGKYPRCWKQANTIILKKPGKPDYTDATAFLM